MLLSPRKNGLTSLFKEVRVFKVFNNAYFCSTEMSIVTKPLFFIVFVDPTSGQKSPISWRAGTTPILEKTLWECMGEWKSFVRVPINSGRCSESCGCRTAQVVGCHSENGISYSENGISNSESCSENAPELSESSENGLFTPRTAFFLKLGWSPGFWKILNKKEQLVRASMTRRRGRPWPNGGFRKTLVFRKSLGWLSVS